MKKAPRTVYRDELLAPPPGEWCVELVLGEDDVEKLMTGRVSRELMETAFRALSWRRGDQDWINYDCACPRCVAERARHHTITRCLEGRCLLEDCPIHGGPNPEGER